MKLLSTVSGIIATLASVGLAAGQEKGKTTFTRPAVVLIGAETKGIGEGAKVKEIEIPKETVARKALRDVHDKRINAGALDREYAVKSVKITLADDTVVECRVLIADDVPEKTTFRNLQNLPPLDAVSDDGSGMWYGYLAKYEVVIDPARDSRAKKKDMQRLQGSWRVVSSHAGDEQSLPEDELAMRTFTVNGNHLTYDFKNDSGDKHEGTINIDPATKAFDFPVSGEVAMGIYELDGDNLKIAFGVDCLVRPKGFEMLKEGVQWLLVLKRVKP